MTTEDSAVFPYANAQAFGAAITARLRSIAGGPGRSTSQLRRQFAFTFQFDAPRALVQGLSGFRVAAEAFLGSRTFERFGVDVVTGAVITGRAEEVEPLLPLAIPGLVRPRYQVYPLVDSVADKVMAIIETHGGRPSPRFRDLVDLVLIARSHPVRADELSRALASECQRRDLQPVQGLAVPDPRLWSAGYRTAVRESAQVPERTLAEALDTVRSLVEPVLVGAAPDAAWDLTSLTWQQHPTESQ